MVQYTPQGSLLSLIEIVQHLRIGRHSKTLHERCLKLNKSLHIHQKNNKWPLESIIQKSYLTWLHAGSSRFPLKYPHESLKTEFCIHIRFHSVLIRILLPVSRWKNRTGVSASRLCVETGRLDGARCMRLETNVTDHPFGSLRERRWSFQCVAYSALWVKQSAQLSNHSCFRWCSVSRASVMAIPWDPWMNLGTSHAPRCASHDQSVSSIDGSPICLSLMLKRITITENMLGHKWQ